jgi:putative ABC transport system ATP-binding protein
MQSIIELQDVSKIYGFGNATTVALDAVTLSIKKGEFIAIMGPSGSGKSTLLNTIGLLDRPTHGTYTLGGRLVSKLRSGRLAKARRDHIGFVFQSFNLLPRLSVIENVALPLAYKGVGQAKRLRRASEMLSLVGLEDREYFLPRTLSGGQAQRAAIARALINSPSIIIADEPTGNLDSHSSRVVMEILAGLHKDGNTILMVTHNPDLTRYATRVLYMYDGAILYDESTKLGEVPERAKNGGQPEKRDDEEEQLASISAFIQDIPERPAPKKTSLKDKKKRGSSTKKTSTKKGAR